MKTACSTSATTSIVTIRVFRRRCLRSKTSLLCRPMNLIEVTNAKPEEEFLLVNVQINARNPNYIRPLDKDIREVFDPAKNKTFRQGKVVRWILKGEDG